MQIRAFIKNAKGFDWPILFLTSILVFFGLAIIYSIGVNNTDPSTEKFQKQLIFCVIGYVILLCITFVDYRIWRNFMWLVYCFGGLLLIGVLIFGITIRGTTGWINLGFAVFQPVEIAKVTLIISLATWFDHYKEKLDKFRYIAYSGIFTGIYVLLVLLQPDLGSALVFVGMWLLLIMVVKIKWWYKALIIGAGIVLALVGWFMLKDYQQDRILVFINPSADPLGQGYNVTQSIIAVGSGQLTGRGLGLGPQSQLNFLPEEETDFIYSVIAEELGLLGAGIVVICFGLLFFRIWYQSRKVNDNYGIYLLLLIIFQFFIQAFINIGMNIGIMPVTGIPLPFISSGGSSLISGLILIGLIEGVLVRQKGVR